MEDRILNIISFCIPAIITGLVAYYFFNLHTKNEEGRRRFALKRTIQKETIPQRLHAYERITLFLERIHPAKLVIAIAPEKYTLEQYEMVLINQIESEFEHNLAQQIYMTDTCWNYVKTAKNATIQFIRVVGNKNEITSAEQLRTEVLNQLVQKEAPSQTALLFIKKEVSEFLD
ncbi:hypothetical protein ACG2LH_06015 [Zhouia sp. PK063]|uniref:DUF7935 family protein n=1 Tax=Zhouia sp. PK063 TaxID=3373602 RepID=UPI0037A8D42E